MKETIKWDKSEYPTRLAVIELCGWVNRRGDATPHGKKMARESWEGLSPATKRILTSHGIEE